MTRHEASPWRWLVWAGVTIAVTLSLVAVRGSLDKAHFALAYLLLVLAGSAAAGHRVGLALSVTAFVLFDWFFVPPYQTLAVTNGADWLVLLSFLIVSVVAAQLMHRLQREARIARAHAAEIDRLAILGVQNAVLASVSHDLRTPLTTIKALAHEMIGADLRAVAIEEEADRLNRMVTDLLDLSRGQSGVAISVQLNAIDDLIGAALQRISGAMAGRAISTSLEDGGTLLVGRFDFSASLRILVNLLDNAHKYSPPGLPIELRAARHGDRIDVSVADRGPGVAVHDRELIFEPFHRAASTPAGAGGAGLGLAIARGLARAEGAELRYAERAGGGSEFVLSVPAADLPDTYHQSPETFTKS